MNVFEIDAVCKSKKVVLCPSVDIRRIHFFIPVVEIQNEIEAHNRLQNKMVIYVQDARTIYNIQKELRYLYADISVTWPLGEEECRIWFLPETLVTFH